MLTKKWDEVLRDEYQKDYFKQLVKNVRDEYQCNTCYPKADEVFKAFFLTDFDQVKIVILGQDPYHGVDEAEGLSFSVKKGIKKPPSLQNIYKELKMDLGIEICESGCLEKWGKEGVLLLNSILTVRKDTPLSHKGIGWETFTDKVIEKINEKNTPVVFILWGAYAKSKKSLITNPLHLIIESSHPSPFSAHYGFFGSKPFSKANEYLIRNKISPVNFNLD